LDSNINVDKNLSVHSLQKY